MSARILQSILLLSSLLLGGCMPYVLPSLEITPPIIVGEDAVEVHVFRVDSCREIARGMLLLETEYYSMSRTPLLQGTVPPQVNVGMDFGEIICVAFNCFIHYHDGCYVRLYRPGYKLVEFKSWRLGDPIKWEPVETLADQELAVDCLIDGGFISQLTCLSDSEDVSTWEVPGGLRPGSYSEKHRDFLLFAASEYERLEQMARSAEGEENCRRLMHKAQKLREHAAKSK